MIKQVRPFAAQAVSREFLVLPGQVTGTRRCCRDIQRLEGSDNTAAYKLMCLVNHSQLGAQLATENQTIHETARASDNRGATAAPT